MTALIKYPSAPCLAGVCELCPVPALCSHRCHSGVAARVSDCLGEHAAARTGMAEPAFTVHPSTVPTG